MSKSSEQRMMDTFSAAFTPDTVNSTSMVRDMLAKRYQWTQPVDVAATRQVICLDPATPYQQRIDDYLIIAATNVTAANTNFATFQLMFNNANGSPFIIAAQADTTLGPSAIGAITMNVPRRVTINTAAAIVPKGSQVVIVVSKTGTGKVLGQLTHSVKVSPA
jgi:hypothetical protein